MKVDTLVKKRLEELEQKAESLLANKQFDFQSNEGVKYYKVDSAGFKAWATSALHLLQKVFGEDSIHYRNLDEQFKQFRGWESSFKDCRAIFQAAKEDYEGGYLFNIRGLIQAEVLDDALEQASELLQAGYKDPACVVIGVILETALKELCTRNSVPHDKLDRMNADLCKAGAYNLGMQKQITAWAERRNKAAHGDWSAYNEADIEDMIKGVTRLIADYL